MKEKKPKPKKLNKDGSVCKKGSRGKYEGYVCRVVRDSTRREGDELHIVCKMEKINDTNKWFTRYQDVQQFLYHQSWCVAKVRFETSVIATNAKVSIPNWLRFRGVSVTAMVSSSTVVLKRDIAGTGDVEGGQEANA